ncbi:MAG TPA: autotransporter domain-containing protein [Bosea sp. (in: a-proteobacteria)]|uniref:autotransporter outer membrane beta-barrel domain-containing protein n=1 Tax=Bosea sp. (in: a-proteobacteria) TaxID=1871050 RepID=UPI002E15E1A3|nr:autotransporter domain-containing protein [Bosea sp. (in: a-proteobacteria)]
MPAAFETRAPAGLARTAETARALRLRNLLLCGVACIWATGAMADGGVGAAGDLTFGGIGGVDSVAGAGGNATPSALTATGAGGAGGGAGATGGSGARGVATLNNPAAAGGAGGAMAGQDGADGVTFVGNGGGGGGGGGAHGYLGSSLPTSAVAGGRGGAGGVGVGGNGDGGGGGAGGYGAVLNGTQSTSAFGFNITGGQGGAGGAALAWGGNGGSGGIGLHATSVLLLTSGTIRGGDGGMGGAAGVGASSSSARAGHGAAGGTGIVGINSILTNRGTVVGGAGGNGANGGVTGGRGGNGGAGGASFLGSDTNFTNIGTLAGGRGGNGGNGGTLAGSWAGSGGAGGAGFSASNATLRNDGTITGGNGGARGTIGPVAGTVGAGGVGVTGSNLTVVNNGTIAGGLSGDGATRANAITFTGGVNTLELWGGSAIIGNVQAFSTADTFRLGGSASGSLDVSQINGFGIYQKTGASNWTLTGTNASALPFTIWDGRLAVNGSLANSTFTVLGGTLGGSGTVGATTVQAGATIAPGNSIGTLTVNGNLTLAPGSTYAAEIGGNGSSDRIAVTGKATVSGSNVIVSAIDPQGLYKQGQRYTLITAAGGIEGGFASVTSSSAFLNLALDAQTGAIGLNVSAKPFGTAADSRNQLATAGGLDSLPQLGGTLLLYNSVLVLDAASGRAAFDQLSGEIHASAKTVLVEESAAVRGAAIDRLRSAFGTVGSAPMATMNYGFTADLAPAVKGPMPTLRSDRFAAWGQGFGGFGRTDGDGNAGTLSRSTGGLMLGADLAVLDTLRIGVLAGYSHDRFDVNSRLSSGESDNYHLGLYGGGQWGAFGLRLGASYTWHDVTTRRTVAFAGFGDALRSSSHAGTAQVFGEVGYRFDVGQIALEPFAGLAYVSLHSDGIREIGGAAALSGRGDDTNVGYSTLGLRASTNVSLNGMDLTLRGALGWRHAFGDVDPETTLAFAGSNAFTVAGLPIAKNAALVEAGLDFAVGKNTTVGLSYTGQLATDARDHAFKANLAVRF